MRNLTASDRQSLIRLAASLPVGDENRRAILSGLKGAATPHRTISFTWKGEIPKFPGSKVTKSGDKITIQTDNRDATDGVLDWIGSENISYAVN